MARVVVLSFEDDEAAEQFCKALTRIQVADALTTATAYGLSLILVASSKLEGLVARPTKACPHPFRYGTFARTKRFGWYVHNQPKCFRPHPLYIRDFVKNMLRSGGCNNLLPELLEQDKEAASA